MFSAAMPRWLDNARAYDALIADGGRPSHPLHLQGDILANPGEHRSIVAFWQITPEEDMLYVRQLEFWKRFRQYQATKREPGVFDRHANEVVSGLASEGFSRPAELECVADALKDDPLTQSPLATWTEFLYFLLGRAMEPGEVMAKNRERVVKIWKELPRTEPYVKNSERFDQIFQENPQPAPSGGPEPPAKDGERVDQTWEDIDVACQLVSRPNGELMRFYQEEKLRNLGRRGEAHQGDDWFNRMRSRKEFLSRFSAVSGVYRSALEDLERLQILVRWTVDQMALLRPGMPTADSYKWSDAGDWWRLCAKQTGTENPGAMLRPSLDWAPRPYRPIKLSKGPFERAGDFPNSIRRMLRLDIDPESSFYRERQQLLKNLKNLSPGALQALRDAHHGVRNAPVPQAPRGATDKLRPGKPPPSYQSLSMELKCLIWEECIPTDAGAHFFEIVNPVRKRHLARYWSRHEFRVRPMAHQLSGYKTVLWLLGLCRDSRTAVISYYRRLHHRGNPGLAEPPELSAMDGFGDFRTFHWIPKEDLIVLCFPPREVEPERLPKYDAIDFARGPARNVGILLPLEIAFDAWNESNSDYRRGVVGGEDFFGTDMRQVKLIPRFIKTLHRRPRDADAYADVDAGAAGTASAAVEDERESQKGGSKNAAGDGGVQSFHVIACGVHSHTSGWPFAGERETPIGHGDRERRGLSWRIEGGRTHLDDKVAPYGWRWVRSEEYNGHIPDPPRPVWTLGGGVRRDGEEPPRRKALAGIAMYDIVAQYGAGIAKALNFRLEEEFRVVNLECGGPLFRSMLGWLVAG